MLGYEKATKVAKILSGLKIYFPKLKHNCRQKIYEAIIKEFDGNNHEELSKKYNYSVRQIYTIVKLQKPSNKSIKLIE